MIGHCEEAVKDYGALQSIDPKHADLGSLYPLAETCAQRLAEGAEAESRKNWQVGSFGEKGKVVVSGHDVDGRGAGGKGREGIRASAGDGDCGSAINSAVCGLVGLVSWLGTFVGLVSWFGLVCRLVSFACLLIRVLD